MSLIQLEKTLFRGPRPQGRRGFRELSELGIRTVLDMTTPRRATRNLDARRALDYGLTPLSLSLSSWRVPDTYDVQSVLEVMTNPKWRPLYVHCHAGVDRTGFVCACYRVIVQGWSLEATLAEFRKLGRHPWFFWWDWFLPSTVWLLQGNFVFDRDAVEDWRPGVIEFPFKED